LRGEGGGLAPQASEVSYDTLNIRSGVETQK